ncbi:Membrane-fusion protein [Ignavibacterium album JCM 16511]|uniref:Membrane-fusion protein n=1 Tax=Ignavibacterium album (strain DSM 19864 / JCM 16511 / NBRC 101810 / Mat9-16) TaxID=945713 RepID=I0AHX1_IGNAJ|nr:efflux RND transporter periplasmic adaptor subunit [Ignavibacterium album]AFH48578.1 Membrane-fusion protein [Ignavibacterium album JCM 16511]
MKKKILIITIIAVVILVPTYFLFIAGSSSSEITSGEKLLYTCGMHPQIISDKPGLCPICEMKLVPIKNNSQNSIQKSGERKILYYRNPMNPNIISDHPQKDEMGMDYVPVYEDEAGAEGVVTIDPQVQQNMNVKTAVVELKKLSSQVTTNGILVTDETQEYIVTTKVDGWIEKLYVNYIGQLVSKGAKLMDIYSPMLVSAQQELLTALSYQASLKGSSLEDIRNGSNELLKNAVRKLQLLNVSDSEIEHQKETRELKTTITLYAQNSGTVLEKNILEGQKIMAGESLLKISNLSTLWLITDIYEYEIPKIKIGSNAIINFTSIPGKTYRGRISFIYPTLDPQSRTVKVRIDVPNKNNELKPSMFANVVIEGPELKLTPVVPENAVIRSGKMDIVILDLGNGKFKPQQVTLGIYSDGYYQVLSGLSEGNRIVTSAQFLIDSESNLRVAVSQFQTGAHIHSSETNVKDKMIEEKRETKNGEGEKRNEKREMKNELNMENHDHSSSIVYNGVIDVQSIDKNKDGKLWECPMDWNVISDESGRCPLCNMKLKEYSITEVKNNLEKNGFEYKR